MENPSGSMNHGQQGARQNQSDEAKARQDDAEKARERERELRLQDGAGNGGEAPQQSDAQP